MLGYSWVSVALVSAACPEPLALVRPPLVFFRPIKHAESAPESVGDRNHSDWLFSLWMIGLISSFNMWNWTGKCLFLFLQLDTDSGKPLESVAVVFMISPFINGFPYFIASASIFPQLKDQGLTTSVPFATSYQTYARLHVAILRNRLLWARVVWKC